MMSPPCSSMPSAFSSVACSGRSHERHHLVAAPDQLLHELGTEKPGRARHEVSRHARITIARQLAASCTARVRTHTSGLRALGWQGTAPDGCWR